MALNLIPERFQKLWKKWDVRSFVLFSLLLQTILILLAPLRKRMPQKRLTILVWFAYLLADWASSFALGLISNDAKGNYCNRPPSKSTYDSNNQDLLALWAPFLLLHLGGPDTITAFALEDNELWIRHLLNLLLQLSAAAYIFFLSFPNNKLWISSGLMFAVGLTKYAERNRALYLASTSRFRDSMLEKPDPGPNYAKLMDEYWWMKESLLPTKITMTKEPETSNFSGDGSNDNDDDGYKNPSDIVLVEKAYAFFNLFKRLLADLIFSFNDREESRKFFLGLEKADQGFKVIEIELGFFYDILYTKASIIHSLQGYCHRVGCFALSLMAFFLFLFSYNKDKLHESDIIATYALFLGAIILDALALLMLLFSDWTIALLNNSSSKRARYLVDKILTKNIFFNRSRWSESASQYNLISFCLCKRPKWVHKIAGIFGLKDFLDEIQYKSRESLLPGLKDLIFHELKEKSSKAVNLKTTKQICSSRGDYVLRNYPDERHILTWSLKVEFDESLLLWHIATDLLYHTEDKNKDDPRKFCKLLSDYMLYLLVIQPTVISAVASIAQIRFRDTCAEAEKFFSRLETEPNKSKSVLEIISGFKLQPKPEHLKQACATLLAVRTTVKPVHVKGDRSKSVLFDAVRLAGNLKELKEKKWVIMSKVWVELLCYAASHCRAHTHAQQVSRGGELVTLIWLLMVHFGLGEQFRIVAGHARAKLIVQKNVGSK